MQMSPLIAIHMSAAIGAVVLGPVALWARKGRRQRPRLHRAFGYAWVTLMLAAAVSAMFIRDFSMPNIAGYTPIHLLVPTTLLPGPTVTGAVVGPALTQPVPQPWYGREIHKPMNP